jgi:hypothetical protein
MGMGLIGRHIQGACIMLEANVAQWPVSEIPVTFSLAPVQDGAETTVTTKVVFDVPLNEDSMTKLIGGPVVKKQGKLRKGFCEANDIVPKDIVKKDKNGKVVRIIKARNVDKLQDSELFTSYCNKHSEIRLSELFASVDRGAQIQAAQAKVNQMKAHILWLADQFKDGKITFEKYQELLVECANA